jgi:RNA polymerase sigma-70 factor (ECF subfamily)
VAAVKLMQRWDQTKKQPVLLSREAIEAVSSAFDRSEAAASRKADALEHCLDKLPEKSRRLLTLRYERSLKIGEIAQELQATLDAVYQSLSRLRVRLQECAERWLAEQGVA